MIQRRLLAAVWLPIDVELFTFRLSALQSTDVGVHLYLPGSSPQLGRQRNVVPNQDGLSAN